MGGTGRRQRRAFSPRESLEMTRRSLPLLLLALWAAAAAAMAMAMAAPLDPGKGNTMDEAAARVSRAHILRQRASETPFGRIIKRREDPFRRITKNHPPMIWAPDLEELDRLYYDGTMTPWRLKEGNQWVTRRSFYPMKRESFFPVKRGGGGGDSGFFPVKRDSAFFPV